ncbi:MAG: preprotein translocase subunit SecY [Oscillospiraceae bacterium]|nr:preprotein translocase subunit SecY [Oscillospiraceae bacterium]MCM0705413.1 preprotein translocase subunit SecY [Faecalicatena sp. BF-R-105]MDY3219986.1 preprotein translocase subunit SecY [Candidatus Fimivivens sp.]SFI81894.1 protein translocase subunit secY/sec61 alpha [Ruminococcaceae bacterium D5]GKH48973.1 protein translocase subunit SecY [Eubacteriales bacterium]
MLDTLRNAWKIEDLRKKLLFTFFILMLTRIGSQIPVPFLDPGALTSMVSSTGGIFSYLDMLTGGAFSRSTLFALSISPYITASIVIQLLTVAIPYLENLAKEGEEGKRRINKITRYTTLALAFLQAFAYTMLLNNQGAIQSFEGWQYYFARIIIILCFTAGAMLIVFMGERIDAKGIGNGISMILFIGIVSRGGAVVNTMIAYLKLAVEGATYYFFAVPFVIVLFLAVIAFIIVMTNAERRIPVQYAKRIVGRKQYGGQSTFIPIKVNMSGVLPIIFASTLLAIPTTIKGFVQISDTSFFGKFLNLFNYNTIWYGLLYFFLIMGFSYFYVAIQYNPIEISNNIRKNSGTVPGIRPGKPTSDYIAKIVSKTTFLGGLFLSVIAVAPIGVGALTRMNISLGGTSVIIVVGVALDMVRQLESQMMMRHYKGFLE